MQKVNGSLIVSYYLGCLACRLKAIRKDRKIPCFRRFSACNIPGKHQQRAWPAPTYRLNAYSLSTLAVTIVLVFISVKIFAGSLDPSAGPDSAASAMYSIEAIYQRLSTGTNVAKRGVGFRGPTGPPGSTMHDLNDVMAKAPSNIVDAATTNDVRSGKPFWGLTTNEWGNQTGSIPTCALSPDTNAVDAGYYAGTNLSEVDTDLASTNIRVDVTLFGVTGANYACFLPKTGQTNSYLTGDDGDLQKGVSWPVPRFTVGTGTNGTNLVTDNTTGLMWARNANMWGNIGWTNAITNCNSLVYGGYDDWRLPNAREMYSLLHFGFSSPVVPDTQGTGQWSQNDPFTGVGSVYWSSTTDMATPANAWRVPYYGGVSPRSKATAEHYVWPVRGGP